MKILPFAMYIKNRVEQENCIDCGAPFIFSRVNYGHKTLVNGGYIHAYGKCFRCLDEAEIVIEVDPIAKEMIDEEPNLEEDIYKTVFYANVKRDNKKEDA